jgi:hypothetical protein
MSIQIVYKKILDIELWHDYDLGQPDPPALPASYNVSDLLAIVPTSDCLRVLKNLRWVFRSQGRGATVFANVDEVTPGNFKTQVPIDQPYRLTFWLVVSDRYFTNFTNLPLSPTQNQIYYFSNLSNNQGHALFLTQPLPIYTASTEYYLGQLVTHTDKTLEALQYQASASPTPGVSDWDTLPGSQYVSNLDRLPCQSSLRMQIIPGVNPGDTFRLSLVDVNGQETFTFEDTAPNNHPPGASISVNLNFSEPIPGRYRLTRNGTQVDEFVLTDPIAARNAFGLVEVVLNSSLVPTAFALLEYSAGQTLIRPKTYAIRFKNRATRWRYRYEKPHGFNPADLPDFDLLDDKTYATKQLLGLRLQPVTFLKDGKDHPLPAASVGLIEPETDAAQHITTIFSDIHL